MADPTLPAACEAVLSALRGADAGLHVDELRPAVGDLFDGALYRLSEQGRVCVRAGLVVSLSEAQRELDRFGARPGAPHAALGKRLHALEQRLREDLPSGREWTARVGYVEAIGDASWIASYGPEEPAITTARVLLRDGSGLRVVVLGVVPGAEPRTILVNSPWTGRARFNADGSAADESGLRLHPEDLAALLAGKAAQMGTNDDRTDADERARKLERILAFLKAYHMTTDARIAEVTGIADRDVLRPLLAELAIDGKVAIELKPLAWQSALWLDNEPPWGVRLAPEGTPSLEDRIVAALAEAGISGLEDLELQKQLEDELEVELLPHVGDALSVPTLSGILEDLGDRRIVRHTTPERWALAAAEWGRRIGMLAGERFSGRDADGRSFEEAVERLLAGREG